MNGYVLGKMKVCADCGKVHGSWKEKGMFNPTFQQRCGCENRKRTTDNSEKWPGFDFNEVVTLCYCCGSDLLTSGSRWSVWFCKECAKKISTVNHNIGLWLIPIGRHSLMHGIGINCHNKNEEEINYAIKEFHEKTESLFKQQNKLYAWARSIVIKNIKRLNVINNGPDMRLSQYLNLMKKTHGDKEECFRKMCESFGINFY